jgi:hypothetical protein
MAAWQRIFRAAAAVCALVVALLTLPAHAHASDTESTIMFDDDQLIYQSPQHAIQVLQQMRGLGVDQVKVSVYWGLIAPHPKSGTRPNFNAADPNAYPAAAWTRYDTIVKEAAKLGMSVYLMLQGQAPDWARAPGAIEGPPLSLMPRLSDWQQFVEAVAKRYSGSFVPSRGGATDVQQISVLGIPLNLGGILPSASAAAAKPLPRVSNWEIWNEPNERSWLTPYYRKVHGRRLLTQPMLYRSLIDTAWQALIATGHAGDTILIGETANVGLIDPMPFLRDLYCVGGNDLPLRGGAAAALFCPASGTAASFVAAHPGLFHATGYAHHPYAFNTAPNRAYANRTFVTLLNIGTMENALNQIFSAYGVPRTAGVPLYLTEWGEETNPPNPFVHTSLVQQETWLNEGQFMTWQDPYVKAITQFELVDNGPKPKETPGTMAYWSTFQMGLEFANGTHKPSYNAFRIPIWLPQARAGTNVTVWGQLRPADHTQVQYGLIQYSQSTTGTWTTLAEPQTTSSEGFVVAQVNIPGAGYVRLGWLDPYSGNVDYSRTVQVSG